MSDRPEWFAPRRYGFGTGWPIAWQGWALIAVTAGLLALAGWLFADNDLAALAIVAPALVMFFGVSASTTKGGWRWRWGDRK